MDRSFLEAQLALKSTQREIGAAAGVSQTTVRYWLGQYDLTTDQAATKRAGRGVSTRYSAESVAQAVASSDSYIDVLRTLGSRGTGRLYRTIRELIDELNLDTSHFTRSRWRTGHPTTFDAESKLVRLPSTGPTTNGSALRRALLEVGRTYECEECSNPGVWMARELLLQVDHIDGDHRNNIRTNLRFLCANCHSQTATFGFKGANAGLTAEEVAARRLCACGSPKSAGSAHCMACRVLPSRKGIPTGRGFDWPDDAALLRQVDSSTYAAVGRLLGVSGEAVSLRARNIRLQQVSPHASIAQRTEQVTTDH